MHYTVHFENEYGVIGDVFTYVLTPFDENKCRVHFLNKLGGYDSFDFADGPSIFDLVYPRGDGEKWRPNELTISTGFITEDVAEWLKEILDSPSVYIEREGNLLPVSIVQSNFKKELNDDNANLIIQIQYDMLGNYQKL